MSSNLGVDKLQFDADSFLSYRAKDGSDAESVWTAETAVDRSSEEARNRDAADLKSLESGETAFLLEDEDSFSTQPKAQSHRDAGVPSSRLSRELDLDATHIPKLYRYDVSRVDLYFTVFVAALPPLAVLAAATWGLLRRTTTSPLTWAAEAALYAALVPATISALQYTAFLVETAFFSREVHYGQRTFFPRLIQGTWLFRTAKEALVAALLADGVAVYLATRTDSEGRPAVVTAVLVLVFVQMFFSHFLFSFWLTRLTDRWDMDPFKPIWI